MTRKRKPSEYDDSYDKATKDESEKAVRRLKKERKRQRRHEKKTEKLRRAEEKSSKKKNDPSNNREDSSIHSIIECPIIRKTSAEENVSAEDCSGTLDKDQADAVSAELFYAKRCEFSIALRSMSINNVLRNIEDILSDSLLRYVDSMGGVLLAFNNVQLNDSPQTPYKFVADTLLFCPGIGSRLNGVVTQSFHSHLSVTVLNFLHACIHAKFLRASGYDFDHVEDQWYKMDNTTRRNIVLNDEINFFCEKIHECGGMLSMEGSNPVVVYKAR